MGIINLLICFFLFYLGAGISSAKEAACDDSKLTYKTCTSQETIFSKSFKEAKHNKKLLLVQYGFEGCPWCQVMHKGFMHGKMKGFIDKNFVFTSINISEKTGKSVFNKNRGEYKESPKKTGYPFLVVINPATNKSVHRDTGDLEDNSNGKGHDLAKLTKALKEAIKKVKL